MLAPQAEEGIKLTPRWTKLRPHRAGREYSTSPHRFNVLPCGRRSGKTERFKRKLVVKAITTLPPDYEPRFFAGAPTRDQAKRIYWDDLKQLTKPFWRQRPSETELVIPLMTAAEIHVLGMDKPERIEGSPWDGGGLDEYANMKAHTWGAHVRPALADRRGWCDFIGVPEGRNHYYEMDMRAISDMREFGDKSEWGHFAWPSSDILDPAEIEAAKRDLDPLTYAQEYEGSFVNFEGRAYYPFQREIHAIRVAQLYNNRAPLILCFDFNIEPGVCAIIQEVTLPGQYQRDANGIIDMRRPITGTAVIAEVHIPRNSNTPAVCNKIIQLFGDHAGPVLAYGDATGGAGGTAKVMGSDWDLIKGAMRTQYGDRFSARVKAANPSERSRINAVNTRLRNGVGDVHLLVDPEKAPNTVKDFEGVALLTGGSGEIDKKRDPKLTHVTDAIGYYVEYEFPIAKRTASIEPLHI